MPTEYALPFPLFIPVQVAADCTGATAGSGIGPGIGMGCQPGRVGVLPNPNQPTSPPLSSGFCCLAAETQVQLWSGGAKPASEVKVGDELVGIAPEGQKSKQIVAVCFSDLQPMVELKTNDLLIRCSESHIFVTYCDEEIVAKEFNVYSDLLRTSSGAPVQVLSVESAGHEMVYGWTCEPDHTFMAAGVLNHNKITPVIDPTNF